MKYFRTIFKNLIIIEPATSLTLGNSLKSKADVAVIGYSAELLITDNQNSLFKDDLNLKPLFFADEEIHTIVEIITAHKRYIV